MEVYFVGDGPTDEKTIPVLVENLIQCKFAVSFSPWRKIRLNRGSGYARKLTYAIKRARSKVLDGIIATLDADKAKRGERLNELKAARQKDRDDIAVNQIPIGVGEAIPHLEAWLIDDSKAVRTVLAFSSDTDIGSVTKVTPKSEMNRLITKSERTEGALDLLSEIARQVSLERCTHSSATGLAEFAEDIRNEFR